MFVLFLLFIMARLSPQHAFKSSRVAYQGIASLSLSQASQSDFVEWDTQLRSPCKLNLFLRILGRQPTGFHDLASLFQAVTLSDDMYFSKLGKDATKDEMTTSDVNLEVDNSNLVIKAFNLMREKTGIEQYFKIYLDKKVPIQAGLGGGSANAATAMFAFNKLCDYPVSMDDMMLWSGEIGSDVTFFFTSGTAYCTGRGEIVKSLLPLKDASSTKVHIFKPTEGLSTKAVFQTLDVDNLRNITPKQLLDSFTEKGSLKCAQNMLVNDLEVPAFTCQPKLYEIKKMISATPGITGAMMSGSGTSIFALSAADGPDIAVEPIMNKFPNLSYFPCNFVNKNVDITSWY
jgi:4-diphosphocytidyl-2-C-methyl-D-erythritol kinase